ncbi:MAG: hypothetical protein WKF84_00245 [Pyrinomonadaceae bacterium]
MVNWLGAGRVTSVREYSKFSQSEAIKEGYRWPALVARMTCAGAISIGLARRGPPHRSDN